MGLCRFYSGMIRFFLPAFLTMKQMFRQSFLCKALLEGAEKLYELRYTVRTHRWTLFREVY